MGRFSRFSAGFCLVTVCRVTLAQGAPTGTFPSPQKPAAAATEPLPPPPPPPPAASGSAVPAIAPSSAASATQSAGPAVAPPPAAPPGYPTQYPSYAAYPPPGYTYYYPPPPIQLSRERLPVGAAVSASPFVDALVTSVSWQNRFAQFLNVGLQAGAYVAGRVRLSANVLLPTSALTDSYRSEYVEQGPGYDYARESSKAASVIFGVGVGIVAVSTPTFVMSPGLVFSHSDVSDYGSSLAAAFPFEWVTASGLRLGFEFDAGRAFGGSYREEQCGLNSGVPAGGCGSVAVLSQDRPTGTSVVLQFQVGFGFNHPDPVPLRAGENGEIYGLPVQPAAAPGVPAAAAPTPAAGGALAAPLSR